MTSKKNYYQIMKPNLKLRSHLMQRKIPTLRMIGRNFQMKENDDIDHCTAWQQSPLHFIATDLLESLSSHLMYLQSLFLQN